MTSPFSEAGPRLREQGISVLTISPGGKAPGTVTNGAWRLEHNWSRFCDRLPTRFEMQFFEKWPDAGVGVALGPASAPAGFQLVAADVDSEDPVVVKALMSVLPPTPVKKAGRKGFTAFYLASLDVKNRPFNVMVDGKPDRALDLLCSGRQTVLPPTLHPQTGQPYRWTTPDTLENFDVKDLPVLADDIAEQIAAVLEPFGHTPAEVHIRAEGTATLDGNSIHRSLNDAALSNLDAWVPALQLFNCSRSGDGYRATAHWRPSATGRPLTQRAANLSIKPFGIKDFNGGQDKGYTPLDVVMSACGTDLDTAFRWLQEHVAPSKPIVLNLTAPKGTGGNLAFLGALPPPPVSEETPEHDEDGVVVEIAPPPPPVCASGLLPPEVCTPPGLLGEIVEWITATAAKPVPQHNLGAAIAFLGAAMGRRWESPTRARTNFYIMGLAPSGFGKDHPMAAVRALAMECGLQKYLAAEETKSDSAIRKMLERFPVAFLMMDEFGGWIAKVLDRRAASHDKRMRDLMLTFFSRANQDYMGSEGATERAVMIRNPHLCIYGASTPDDLWSAFDSSSGKDGLLARFLVLDAGEKRPRRVRPALDVTEPPRELIRRMRTMMDVRPAGNLNGVGDQTVKPIRAEWGGGAEEWFIACDEANMDASDRGGARGTVYARVAEHILKLALVYAVGCEPQRPAITVAGLEWARVVVEHSMAVLFAAMDDRVADNDRQSEYLWVLRTIREGGAWGIPAAVLKKAINGRFDKRRFDDIIGQLQDAGEVETINGSGPAGGRPTMRYRAKSAEAEAA